MNYLPSENNPLLEHLHSLFSMVFTIIINKPMIKQSPEELKEKFNTSYFNIELLISSFCFILKCELAFQDHSGHSRTFKGTSNNNSMHRPKNELIKKEDGTESREYPRGY